MSKITYSTKSDINTSATPSENKITAANMNEIKNVVNNNDDLLSNITGTILWTNPSPASNFAEQTISLDSDDYDILAFIWKTNTGENRTAITRTLKGNGTQIDFFSTAVATRVWTRRTIYVSDVSYSIGNCSRMEYGQSTIYENGYCIPLYVIGYKTGLF